MTADLERMLRDIGPIDAAEAQERFVRRAVEDGLADVAYAPVDSPVGELVAAVTRRGLVRLAYEDGRGDAVLSDLAARVSPRVIEAPARLDDVRRQLDEYFAGRRHAFDLGLDWTLAHGFTRRVLESTARIPFGELGRHRCRERRRRAGGRQRPGREPDADRRPVPPHRAHRRRPRRLHRRRAAQGVPAHAGRDASALSAASRSSSIASSKSSPRSSRSGMAS